MQLTNDPITALPSRLLTGDAAIYRENFNRRPFICRHSLADHPLFQVPRLLELGRSLAANSGEVWFDSGKADIGQRWDEMPVSGFNTAIEPAVIENMIRRIETANAWVVIRHAELDPEYKLILDSCMAEIKERICRDLKHEMKVQHAIIFISSPERISSYHIDRECNFLLQVQGSKEIHIFEQSDRTVLPEEEIERFWAVDNNAAKYKPEYQDRAKIFQLAPGNGVHIPVNAPHWVKNGSEVSVSLSINFHFRDELLADIYKMNHVLRKLGMHPTPPGSSILADAVKRTAYQGVKRAAAIKSRFSAIR